MHDQARTRICYGKTASATAAEAPSNNKKSNSWYRIKKCDRIIYTSSYGPLRLWPFLFVRHPFTLAISTAATQSWLCELSIQPYMNEKKRKSYNQSMSGLSLRVCESVIDNGPCSIHISFFSSNETWIITMCLRFSNMKYNYMIDFVMLNRQKFIVKWLLVALLQYIR